MRTPIALRVDQNSVVWQWLRHQYAFLRRVEHEFGVFHAERIKDVPPLESIERLARNDLDHAAKHIGGMAVAPERAGLRDQRYFRYALGKPGIVKVPSNRCAWE